MAQRNEGASSGCLGAAHVQDRPNKLPSLRPPCPHLRPPHQLLCLQDLVVVLHHAAWPRQEAHQRGARVPALQVVVQADDDVVAACGARRRGSGRARDAWRSISEQSRCHSRGFHTHAQLVGALEDIQVRRPTPLLKCGRRAALTHLGPAPRSAPRPAAAGAAPLPRSRGPGLLPDAG